MEEKFNCLDELLKKVKKLKNEHTNVVAFNVYQILRLNDKELMHSRFIKALLNPNESHGYKDKFLTLFLKRVGISNFSTNNITIECEKNTNSNRYIDIAIENKLTNQMIIIENKIWAGDLTNQLFDYYQFGMNLYKKSENIFLLYLTPFGRTPSDNSFPKDKDQPQNGIKCISYETDIISWLGDCLKLIGDKNRLYYCIEMYIELIYKTINRDKYMEEILKYLVNNSSQMEVAIDVVKAFQSRNFLEFNSDSRNLIIKNITKSFEILGIETDPYLQQDGIYYFDKIHGDKNCDLIIEKDCIYGENSSSNTIKTELEIIGNDLNNKYLVALLTNNEDLIKEWITKTINHLTGEAENL
ncbi:MAG: PD-(D/E)XK nuclease family protein [Bacteroidales bacterium]|jgi:hypothetical protein|nr:PD-(D/E)XK nuclease family protein [Bacteroidales bacterium]